MKRLFFLIIFCSQAFAFSFCNAQAGEWVWLHGSASPYSNGNAGIKGVSNPTNEPPALYEPCEWTDLNGNFWMFGGISQVGFVHDNLWKYDPIANQWTWVAGTNTLNSPGNYGIKGIPSAANNPSARGYASASWTDLNGNLWMFGGNDGSKFLSDLWKYDLVSNEWTWINGPNTGNAPGNYGLRGVPDTANYPPCREECSTAWTDNAGDLWLFGGLGYAGYNDLWRYNIATNSWTWMNGSSLGNQIGIYGTKGVEDSANVPSYHDAHCRWKDNNGNLWFYGGSNGFNYNVYDDLWRYNIATGRWTWMSGDSTLNIQGIYGSKCVASQADKPGERFENRAA